MDLNSQIWNSNFPQWEEKAIRTDLSCSQLLPTYSHSLWADRKYPIIVYCKREDPPKHIKTTIEQCVLPYCVCEFVCVRRRVCKRVCAVLYVLVRFPICCPVVMVCSHARREILWKLLRAERIGLPDRDPGVWVCRVSINVWFVSEKTLKLVFVCGLEWQCEWVGRALWVCIKIWNKRSIKIQG